MMEVALDGTTLILIACLSFVLEGMVYWFTVRRTHWSGEEKQLAQDLLQLQWQERKLKSVSTFVEHSKLLRHMNTLKKKQEQCAGKITHERSIVQDNSFFKYFRQKNERE